MCGYVRFSLTVRRVVCIRLFACMIAGLAIAPLAVCTEGSAKPKPLQLGMAKTFFTDMPKCLVYIFTYEFNEVMKKTTGLDGELISKYGPLELAEKLVNKELDFGMFHGHEFAWVQKKFPELQPLLLAPDEHDVEHAYLVVHKDSPAKTVAELRGKKLYIPVGTKGHCRLFVEKVCRDSVREDPAAFFGAIEKSLSPTDALDAACRDKNHAAVVDTCMLAFYKEIKGPVFAKNLRVFQQSESFPSPVVVFKPGTVDEATVKQFRDRLLKAHTTALGRELMKLANMRAFVPISKDYTKLLENVRRSYPPPEAFR